MTVQEMLDEERRKADAARNAQYSKYSVSAMLEIERSKIPDTPIKNYVAPVSTTTPKSEPLKTTSVEPITVTKKDYFKDSKANAEANKTPPISNAWSGMAIKNQIIPQAKDFSKPVVQPDTDKETVKKDYFKDSQVNAEANKTPTTSKAWTGMSIKDNIIPQAKDFSKPVVQPDTDKETVKKDYFKDSQVNAEANKTPTTSKAWTGMSIKDNIIPQAKDFSKPVVQPDTDKETVKKGIAADWKNIWDGVAQRFLGTASMFFTNPVSNSANNQLLGGIGGKIAEVTTGDKTASYQGASEQAYKELKAEQLTPEYKKEQENRQAAIDKAAKIVDDWAEKNKVTSTLSAGAGGLEQGTKNLVKGLGGALYKDELFGIKTYDSGGVLSSGYQQSAQDNKGLEKLLGDLTYSMGNMAPTMLIGSIAGSPGLGALLMGVGSAQGNYEDKRRQYADTMPSNEAHNKALIYGVLTGASEGALQYFIGSIPGISTKSAGGSLIKSPIARKLVSVIDDVFKLSSKSPVVQGLVKTAINSAVDISGEALEEGLQEYVYAGLNRLLFDEKQNYFGKGGLLETSAYSAFLGALTAGILGVPGNISTNSIFKKEARSKELQAEVDKFQQRVREQVPVSEIAGAQTSKQGAQIETDSKFIAVYNDNLTRQIAEEADPAIKAGLQQALDEFNAMYIPAQSTPEISVETEIIKTISSQISNAVMNPINSKVLDYTIKYKPNSSTNTANASVDTYQKVIYVTDKFMSADNNERIGVLQHEISHDIFDKWSKKTGLNAIDLAKTKVFGYYDEAQRKFITPRADKNAEESAVQFMADLISDPNLKQTQPEQYNRFKEAYDYAASMLEIGSEISTKTPQIGDNALGVQVDAPQALDTATQAEQSDTWLKQQSADMTEYVLQTGTKNKWMVYSNDKNYIVEGVDKEQVIRNYNDLIGEGEISNIEPLYDYRKRQLAESEAPTEQGVQATETQPIAQPQTTDNIFDLGLTQNTQTEPMAVAELTADENNLVQMAKAKFNREVIITDNLPGNAEGMYDKGKIYVGRNADNVYYVFGHELTHSLEVGKDNQQAYNRLSRYVADTVIGRKNMQAEIEATKQHYAEIKPDMTDGEAYTEVIAKATGKYLFTDADAIAKIVRTDRSLASKIVQFLRETATRLAGTKEQKAVLKAIDLYRAALKQANTTENGKTQFATAKSKKDTSEQTKEGTIGTLTVKNKGKSTNIRVEIVDRQFYAPILYGEKYNYYKAKVLSIEGYPNTPTGSDEKLRPASVYAHDNIISTRRIGDILIAKDEEFTDNFVPNSSEKYSIPDLSAMYKENSYRKEKEYVDAEQKFELYKGGIEKIYADAKKAGTNVPDEQWDTVNRLVFLKARAEDEMLKLSKKARSSERNETFSKMKKATKQDYKFFNTVTTGMSGFDRYLNEKDLSYMKSKGLTGYIVEMPPLEYIERTAKQVFKRENATYEDTIDLLMKQRFERKVIENYADMMNKGTRFDLPVMALGEGMNSQEGRHRAMAAYINGSDVIPVLLVQEIPKDGSEPKYSIPEDKAPKLPKELAGAKPKYGYKNKLYDIEFANDTDKALYIVGGKNKSARHNDYMLFLRQSYKGADGSVFIELGNEVREELKTQAAKAKDGDVLKTSGNQTSELNQLYTPETKKTYTEEKIPPIVETDESLPMKSTKRASRTAEGGLNADEIAKNAEKKAAAEEAKKKKAEYKKARTERLANRTSSEVYVDDMLSATDYESYERAEKKAEYLKSFNKIKDFLLMDLASDNLVDGEFNEDALRVAKKLATEYSQHFEVKRDIDAVADVIDGVGGITWNVTDADYATIKRAFGTNIKPIVDQLRRIITYRRNSDVGSPTDEVVEMIISQNSAAFGGENRPGTVTADEVVQYLLGYSEDLGSQTSQFYNPVKEGEFDEKGFIKFEAERIYRDALKQMQDEERAKTEAKKAAEATGKKSPEEVQAIVDKGIEKSGYKEPVTQEQLDNKQLIPNKITKDGKSVTVRGVFNTSLHMGLKNKETYPDIIDKTVNGNGTYTPESNKKTLDAAQKKIDRLGYDGALSEWEYKVVNDMRIRDIDVAAAELLYKAAIEGGQGDIARKLLSEIAMIGTENGQAIQIISLFNKLNGEAHLITAQKIADRLNKQTEEQRKKQEKAPIEIPDNLAEKVRKAKTPAEKDAAFMEIKQDMYDQLPYGTWWERWNAWRYISMLGNFKTNIKNVGGNMGMLPLVAAKNLQLISMEKVANDKRLAQLKNIQAQMSKVKTKEELVELLGKANREDIGYVERLTQQLKDAGQLFEASILKTEMLNLNKQIEDGIGIYRTRAFHKSKAAHDFAVEDFKARAKSVMSGSSKYMGIPNSEFNDRRIFKFGLFEGARKLTNKPLEYGDKVFINRYYVNALASFLGANNVDIDAAKQAGEAIAKGETPADENAAKMVNLAREYATQEAREATFRDFSLITETIVEFRDAKTVATKHGTERTLKQSERIARRIAVDSVLPFVGTLVNITRRGAWEYNVGGLAKTILFDTNKVKTGEMSATTYLNNIAKGTTGSAVVLMGYFLGAAGIIVGRLPEDENEKDLAKTAGQQAYSLILGDHSYTIDWIAPFCIPLFLGVELSNLKKSGATQFKDYYQAGMNILSPLFELTLLKSVADVVKAVKYENEPAQMFGVGVSTLGLNYLAQGTPTLFGQISRTITKEQKTSVMDEGNPFTRDQQFFVQKIMGKLFMNQNKQDYVNMFGETKDAGNVAQRIATNFFLPWYSSKLKDDATIKGMISLEKEKTDGLGVNTIPKIPSASLPGVGKYENKTFQLTADQLTELKKQVGIAQKLAADAFITSKNKVTLRTQYITGTSKDGYKNSLVSFTSVKNNSKGMYSDEDLKVKAIDKAMNKAYNDAVIEFIKAHNDLTLKK